MNWRLPKLTGTKESIKPKVLDLQIGQPVKDFILSEIASLPGEDAIVSVTGYSATHQNPMHKEASTVKIEFTISSAVL